MKKLILFVALLLFFGWLMSCLTNKKAASTSSQDTIVDEGDFQTQAEINEEFGNASIEYKGKNLVLNGLKLGSRDSKGVKVRA